MGDGVKSRSRLKTKKHRKQKRRRDQVKSIIAAYVSGKVPLSKIMNPNRLTAPRNRRFQHNIQPSNGNTDLPGLAATNASTLATANRHKRAILKETLAENTTTISTGTNVIVVVQQQQQQQQRPQQKGVVTSKCSRESDKFWQGGVQRDKCGNNFASTSRENGDCSKGNDDKGETNGQTSDDTCPPSKPFALASDPILENSLIIRPLPQPPIIGDAVKEGVVAESTFAKGATASVVYTLAIGHEVRLRDETNESHPPEPATSMKCGPPKGEVTGTAGDSEPSTPKISDAHSCLFDYENFARYRTVKCSPRRRSVGPSLRWRTSAANFNNERQNLLELIKGHENVEQCLVKQIVHLRRERDKYRHAYIDLVKIHKILANRWLQFKKLNID